MCCLYTHLLLQLKWIRWSLTSWSFTPSQSWLLRSGWWTMLLDKFRYDAIIIIIPEFRSLGLRSHFYQTLLLCVQIWRIENLELKEVDRSTYGQFYGGDCYLVLYTYNRANKPQYILYMWQVMSITWILYLQHNIYCNNVILCHNVEKHLTVYCIEQHSYRSNGPKITIF